MDYLALGGSIGHSDWNGLSSTMALRQQPGNMVAVVAVTGGNPGARHLCGCWWQHRS